MSASIDVQAGLASADTAGNTVETARNLWQLKGKKTVNEQVGSSDRRDYFRFRVASATRADFSLSGFAYNLDLYLYDKAGQLLKSSKTGGVGPESMTANLGVGQYTVLVRPKWFGQDGIDYKLTITPGAEPAASDRAGNSLANARNLGPLKQSLEMRDRVDASDRVDFYRFRIFNPRTVELRLNELGRDADLRLFDAQGNRIATADRNGTTPELIKRQLTGGIYYASVVTASNVGTDYRLVVRKSFDAPAEPPPAPPAAAPDPIPGDARLPDVAYYGRQSDWNLNAVNAPEAWAAGYFGEDTTIAVIDTGVDLRHPELSSSLWVNPGEVFGNGVDDDGNGFVDDVYGYDFVDFDPDPRDKQGHGTKVAGVIAAARDGAGTTGVAYGAKIMSIRVFDDAGNGVTGTIASGIRYAVRNGADIINLSLTTGASQAVKSALEFAAANDVLVVSAAGNSSGAKPSYPAIYSATLDNTLSAGAHDPNNRRAGFSNRVGSSGAVQIDAPGSSILTTKRGGGYTTIQGTSFAVPHLTGIAALMRSANPSASAVQLRDWLVAGADRRIGNSDAQGGANAARSVAAAALAAGRAIPTPPAPPTPAPEAEGPDDGALEDGDPILASFFDRVFA